MIDLRRTSYSSQTLAVARLSLLGALIATSAPAASARAYSDPIHYAEPVELGGGGGRWFTGSSADGYACGVCHSGGSPSALAVRGLPLEGFVPGAEYEISLLWPLSTSSLALVAEVTDEQRVGAGTLALPREDAQAETERCGIEAEGHPASQLHTADSGRQLVSVIDCGARMVRFLWTAPQTATSAIWFHVGFVASDKDGSPAGDGVTVVRQRLPAMGEASDTRAIAQGCSASATVSHESWPAWPLLTAIALMLRRKRLREPSYRCCASAFVIALCACVEGRGEARTGQVYLMPGSTLSSADYAPADPDAIADAGAGGHAGADAAVEADAAQEVDAAGTEPQTPINTGALTITFTTVNPGGRYAPRNVGAVFVSTASGQFIRTLERWASVRARYLTEWNAASGGWPVASEPSADQLDAISRATLRGHETHQVIWNLTDLTGQLVPDGRYRVVIEVADDEERPSTWVAVELDKGSTPWVVTPPDEPPFAQGTFQYEP